MSELSLIDGYENDAPKISRLIQGLTHAEMVSFPVPGTWSIQQIVLHLADSEQVFADRIKRVIAEDNPSLLAFDENKWTANLQYDAQSAPEAGSLIDLTRRQISRILRALPEAAFDRRARTTSPAWSAFVTWSAKPPITSITMRASS